MVFGLLNRNRPAEGIARPDKNPKLKLVIETPARRHHGCVAVPGFQLAHRPRKTMA